MKLKPVPVRSTVRRRAITLGALAVVPVVLAGCAGTSAGPGGDGDVTTVVISMQRAIEPAAIYAGIEQGFFEDHGIDLELAPAEMGGPASVPALINGDIHLSIGSAYGYLVAVDANQPLQFVAPLSYGTDRDGNESSGVAVAPGSDIESFADLKGKTIAVAAINGVQAAALDLLLQSEGGLAKGDYSFVELPPPNMEQAITSGQVDAAYLFEPTLSSVLAKGLREIATPIVDVWKGETMVLTVYGEKSWISENTEVMAAFDDALEETYAWVNDNRDDFVKIAAEFTEIPAEVVESSRIPVFRTDSDPAKFKAFAEDMVGLGAIKALPDDAVLTATR